MAKGRGKPRVKNRQDGRVVAPLGELTHEDALHLQINSLNRKIDSLMNEINRDERQLEKVLAQLLGTALALAAGLFWRDAILSTINRFLPPEQTWEWEVIAAVLFTLIASLLILASTRWSHRR
jgi:hypothetical protein